MKMSKLFTWLAVVGCLVAYPMYQAYAAWNIQQRPNGGTTWTNADGVRVGVGGGSHLQVTVDMSSANTRYVLTHRGGVIRRAYLMLNTAFTNTADPSLTLYRIGQGEGFVAGSSGFSPGQATQVSHPNGWTLTTSTGTAGDVFHLSTAPTVNHTLAATANVIGIVPSAALGCSNDTNISCSVNVIIVIE